jgi:hypothetical protein
MSRAKNAGEMLGCQRTASRSTSKNEEVGKTGSIDRVGTKELEPPNGRLMGKETHLFRPAHRNRGCQHSSRAREPAKENLLAIKRDTHHFLKRVLFVHAVLLRFRSQVALKLLLTLAYSGGTA